MPSGSSGSGSTPQQQAAAAAKMNRERTDASAQLDLAGQLDSSTLSNHPYFSFLNDPNLESAYTSQINTILQGRAAPGLAGSTILANPLMRPQAGK